MIGATIRPEDEMADAPPATLDTEVATGLADRRAVAGQFGTTVRAAEGIG